MDKSHLTEFDWRVLGHELYKNDRMVLPARRIDVAIPYQPDGFHTLAHRFAGLSEELHSIARQATMGLPPRLIIGDGMSQIMQMDRFFKQLRKAWETEYRELCEQIPESENKVTILDNRRT